MTFALTVMGVLLVGASVILRFLAGQRDYWKQEAELTIKQRDLYRRGWRELADKIENELVPEITRLHQENETLMEAMTNATKNKGVLIPQEVADLSGQNGVVARAKAFVALLKRWK